MTRTCPRPVHVADGYPPGQCQRRPGHEGLCDAYDGRDEPERSERPYTSDMGVVDFTGARVL